MKIWQRMVKRWSLLVFRERYTEITPKIRVLRVLEEAAELAQAEGVTEEEFDHIKRQVFGKPPGEWNKELGAVLICLAGYASTRNADLEWEFWNEFERIMDPGIMEKVRKRNLEGDKIGFVKKLLAENDWIPIDQFKDEVDGFVTDVLVNNEIIEGHYECGRTWGWADAKGNWIYPTHFRFKASSITGMETLASSIDKASKASD